MAGYLLAEVLERQRAEVRDLLLRTSMLERVSGPLANSLTDLPGLWREVPPSSAVIVQPGDDQEVPFTPHAPD